MGKIISYNMGTYVLYIAYNFTDNKQNLLKYG